jgi:hypothetical protein
MSRSGDATALREARESNPPWATGRASYGPETHPIAASTLPGVMGSV